MAEKINVKWVVAHEPVELFLRSANLFGDIIREMSNDRINIEVLTVTDWRKKYNLSESVKGYQSLKDNIIQMGQYQTTVMGMLDKNYNVLDMPFLFKDHDHVDRVLNGTIGENLLKSLGKKSQMTGLAFTYSGGFRIMINKDPVTKLEELNGKSFSCVPSPVISETLKSIGINPVIDSSWGIDDEKLADVKLDGSETTFVRFDKVKDAYPYIVDTKHSLFLTTIVINTEFYNSLSDDDKEIFKIAAKKAAEQERKQTIIDSINFKNNHASICSGLYEFSEEDIEKFKLATQSLYTSDFAKKSFTPGLLKAIEAA